MATSGNGRKPHTKSTGEVAAELRQRLERELGRERTEAIWRDPTSIEQVIQDDAEAASVAGIILQAWKDLPSEEGGGRTRRHSGFRRGLQLALLATVAVWTVALLRKARPGGEDG
jgi:hypothetical protein